MSLRTRALAASRVWALSAWQGHASFALHRIVTLCFATLFGFVVMSLCGAPARAQEPGAGAGTILGRVVDAVTDAPVEGVRVILIWPAPEDGSEAREEAQITDGAGDFAFESVPAGSYSIEFIKQGYGPSTLRDFALQTGQTRRADLRMAPLAAAEGEEGPPSGVEEIVVLGARVQAIEASRQESDEMINTLSAAEISKFAASDVADVILRVPGVNVVEGQFAIIRGLEDRYSSTLYNSAVVPSPDPDRQSPQLDLFPTEIVSDLVVAKTFGPDLPSNSSGGSINVLTSEFPEEIETRAKFKLGFNENAVDKFLRYDDNNMVGVNEAGLLDTYAAEGGAYVGGRQLVLGRELRFKLLGNWEDGRGTANGFQESREPRTQIAAQPSGDLENGELSLSAGYFDLTESDWEQQKTGFGALGFDLDEAGNHGIDFSIFWTRKDQEVVQQRDNGYFPDLDYLKPGGAYEIETIEGTEVNFDSAFSGVDFGGGPGTAPRSTWIGDTRDSTVAGPQGGPLWFGSFVESKSFQVQRDLWVPQLNGRHVFETLPGLELEWVGNYAETTQEDEGYGARMWYEPCGYSFVIGNRFACPAGVTRVPVPTAFPVSVAALGPGLFAATNDVFISANDVEETQWFGRFDGEYERELTDWLGMTVASGIWYEKAERDYTSNFLPQQEANQSGALVCPRTICIGSGSRPATVADTLQNLGQALGDFAFILDGGPNDPTRNAEGRGEREIQALHLGGKTTFWEDVDLLAGIRLEDIYIESDNEPFQVGSLAREVDNSPAIYPSKYLFFDRFGDNLRREQFPGRPPWNDQVLGLETTPGPCRPPPLPGQPPGAPPNPNLPVLPGPCVDLIDRAEIEQFVDGEIDEREYLPSVGLAYRPLEGLALRAAWSRTVARPSFRELGYYVSVEPASDDKIVGNPQLQLSEVESWDARVEYFYGDFGDLVAVSGFYKTIDDPIESIIVRNGTDFLESLSLGLFRTFFNNPNRATLWGVELEARKSLGFVREVSQIEWLGLGSRLAFLDRDFLDYLSVGGNFTWIDAEVDRTVFELIRSQNFYAPGNTLEKSRRLYGQPEWMVNADVTFDHPDWGTRLTLAFYGISDVLDAAGAATVGRNGDVEAITLDRYLDSFHRLDLVFSQKVWGGVGVKLQAKNLTDSRRDIVYDPTETSGKIEERSYEEGREYTFELNYSFSELPFFED